MSPLPVPVYLLIVIKKQDSRTRRCGLLPGPNIYVNFIEEFFARNGGMLAGNLVRASVAFSVTEAIGHLVLDRLESGDRLT